MMTHLSLFSGIGGLDLAAETVGFRSVGQCEFADYPFRVLCRHWPLVPKWRDVRTLETEDFVRRTGVFPGELTLVSGGFPCQDISDAGAANPEGRKGLSGERSGLWKEMWRIIYELKPKYVLVENVPALLHRGMGTVLTDLYESGFDAEWAVVLASAFGAPHRRKRIFILAKRNTLQDSDRKGLQGNVRPLLEDSFERRQDPDTSGSDKWNPAPRICGRADGLPNRVDRLRCLGNAVVPKQVVWILRGIALAEASVIESLERVR